MEKKYEQFRSELDLAWETNLVWDFINCKICHKESQHAESLHSTLVKKFTLCEFCEKEIDKLKK